MKIEFIYWFAYYNLDSSSVRYRAKYPLDYFKKNKGINYYLIVPCYSPKGIYIFLKAYISALFFRKKKSLIVIQRVKSNFIYANLLKFLVRLQKYDTIYDLDDADYLEINPKTIYYFVKNCEKISAGSEQIKNHLSCFNQHVFHTTSPIVDLNILKKNKSSFFTIGWIGEFAGDHKKTLIEVVFPALKQLTFYYKFVLIGILKPEDGEFIKNYFSENLNLVVEIPLKINWNDEKDIQIRISNFDIGIATLANNLIHLSKSGIKVKQYMNNGVPVLSSNLPENNKFISVGENGYFCSNVNEFKDKFNEFYNMSNTDYLQFSKKARESIGNFDHNKYYDDFMKIKNGI